MTRKCLMWDELLIATALMLVLEGILPLLSPQALRELLLNIIQMDNRAIRYSGFFSMVVGAISIYLLKN